MISQLSRQPWEHFFNWLKKKSNEFHKYNLGGVQAGLEESEPAAVADLVCHKAAEIQNEFVQLLNGDKWIDVLHRLDTSDIKKQRDHFKHLSAHMISSVQLFGVNQKAYSQFCPMANSNKGAYWLSLEKEIQNPYYGQAMLTCGEVRDTFE